MPKRRKPTAGLLRRAIPLLALAILLPAGALPVRADEWSLSSATGPVFTLDDGAWVEIIEGEVVDVGVPLRTLRRAKAKLSSGDIEITLGAESAVRIDSEGGTATVISQFSGTDNIETVAAEAFFDKTINALDPGDEFAASLAKQYETLRKYLQNNFKEVKVYRSGKIQVHIFICCFTETGECFAVHTISVET